MPHDEISIQLYTLRDAMEDQAGFDLVLNRLAQYGYEKVELAGNYGGRTPRELRTFLDDLGIRASSSHDGLSNGDRAAMHAKFARAVTLGQKYVVVPFLNDPTLEYWEDAAKQMNDRGRPREEVRAALRLPQPRPRVHHRALEDRRDA